MKYHVTIGERQHEVELIERLGELVVTVNGEPMALSYEEADRLGQVILLHEGRGYGMSLEGNEREVSVGLAGHQYHVAIQDERERAAQIAEQASTGGAAVLKAIMPGVVVEILVAVGERVSKGQPLLILEAMKMQNEITAPSDGVVREYHVGAGQALAAGEKLATLAPAEGEA